MSDLTDKEWQENKETLRGELDAEAFARIENAYLLMQQVEASRLGDTTRSHDETLRLALSGIADAQAVLTDVKASNDEHLEYLDWSLSREWRLFVPFWLWRFARRLRGGR